MIMGPGLSKIEPPVSFGTDVVHFYRNVFSHVPSTKVREVARMLQPSELSAPLVVGNPH